MSDAPSGEDVPTPAGESAPMQRWGTCCPFDPECDHSFIDDLQLERWMNTPLTDAQAAEVEA